MGLSTIPSSSAKRLSSFAALPSPIGSCDVRPLPAKVNVDSEEVEPKVAEETMIFTLTPAAALAEADGAEFGDGGSPEKNLPLISEASSVKRRGEMSPSIFPCGSALLLLLFLAVPSRERSLDLESVFFFRVSSS